MVGLLLVLVGSLPEPTSVGRTLIFIGILTAIGYTDILEAALIPFIEEYYPAHHCFQQDNNPKHTNIHVVAVKKTLPFPLLSVPFPHLH